MSPVCVSADFGFGNVLHIFHANGILRHRAHLSCVARTDTDTEKKQARKGKQTKSASRERTRVRNDRKGDRTIDGERELPRTREKNTKKKGANTKK